MEKLFIYNLFDSEGSVILTHTKEFSKEEFSNMCKEAPKGGMKFRHPFYSSSKIQAYLIEKYKFKRVEYTTGFYIDQDVE